MTQFLKGVFPGALLTWLVCLFIGSAGSRGGFLNIGTLHVLDQSVFWSWPLFFAGTALAWIIFLMME